MANPQFPHPFKKLLANFRRYRGRLPLKISQKALLEIKDNFKMGGYRGEVGTVAWKKRKSQKDAGRALLIKSGRLRRSLKAAPIGGDPRVVTDVPYAQALHEGFKGTVNIKKHLRKGRQVRSHSRKVDVPARPFMTVGPQFMKEMETMVINDLDNLFTNS